MTSHSYIITSAPIAYEIGSYDLYDSFDLVSQGKLLAPLRPGAAEAIREAAIAFEPSSETKIYAASAGQTLDTAFLLAERFGLPASRVVPSPLLDPIRFSMSNLVAKPAFLAMPRDLALNQARRVFATKLYRGELDEPLDSVLARMQGVLDLAKEPGLFVGHGFYMRVMEVWLIQPEALASQEMFVEAFAPDRKPYDSLAGFPVLC